MNLKEFVREYLQKYKDVISIEDYVDRLVSYVQVFQYDVLDGGSIENQLSPKAIQNLTSEFDKIKFIDKSHYQVNDMAITIMNHEEVEDELRNYYKDDPELCDEAIKSYNTQGLLNVGPYNIIYYGPEQKYGVFII